MSRPVVATFTHPTSSMSCPPDPLGFRPNAEDILGPSATGYVPLYESDAGTDEVRARFRDLFPALSVELPVDGKPAMRAGAVYTTSACATVDDAATIDRKSVV